jgi:glycosidase
VIYLIMPDRFADGDSSNDKPSNSTGNFDRSQPMAYHGGDLRGIRQHLPYLHDLGVTTLWLTPVWKNTDSDYHGYHVVDFYGLDDHMGSMEEYQGLVADAHKMGMKVLIDYVVNHTGPKHPWASDPPSPQWLHGTPEQHLSPSYQFFGLVDPHASPRQYRNVLEGWFADKLPDLNPDDPALGQYLVQNALWWTEIGRLDGFRLDTFPYSARHFWSGWHGGMRHVYRDLFSIGEVSDPDPTITSFFEGGRDQFDGVDSRATTVFDFPLYYALRDVTLRGAPVVKIVNVLRQDSLYTRPDLLVTFIGNHDTRRFMGEAGASKEKLKAAFSLLLTIRGIPQIYSGDEIGMPGGDDPDNRHDFPGGFPGDSRNAFTSGGRTLQEEEIFAHVQSLLRLRQAHPALRGGRQQHIGWDDTYYAFLRQTRDEKLLVVFNNAPEQREVRVPLQDTVIENAKEAERLFGEGQAHVEGGTFQVELPATSVAIYLLR